MKETIVVIFIILVIICFLFLKVEMERSAYEECKAKGLFTSVIYLSYAECIRCEMGLNKTPSCNIVY
jgi:hypothetical protein